MSNVKSTTQNSKLKITFLGTPSFVQPIKDALTKHFILADSLAASDLIVVAAYGKILTEQELKTPKFGAINIHPSLLPKYRGPSPIQSAILNGDKASGITIIKMDAGIDRGPIIYQDTLELSEYDTFDTLSKKMFSKSAQVLPGIITDFVAGKITPVAQDDQRAAYCKFLTRKSGYFDINNPPQPEALNRKIRAYYPWPGVWTKWRNKIIKFLPSASHPERSEGSSAFINSKDSSSKTPQNDKFLIQMEGKKALGLKDFLNGYPDFPVSCKLS